MEYTLAYIFSFSYKGYHLGSVIVIGLNEETVKHTGII